MVVQAGCMLEPLPLPFTATALDGRIITRVTHKTVPVTLVTSGNNSEPVPFLVIPASKTLMFLGYPVVLPQPPDQLDTGQGGELELTLSLSASNWH